MDEDRHAELLGLGPERVELWVAELLAVDAAADANAAQPVVLDGFSELLGSKIGVLQRHRGEGDETVGMRGASPSELLVLDLDDGASEVAVGLVAVRVDAQRLKIGRAHV